MLDDDGDTRDVWSDEFIRETAPWGWWEDIMDGSEHAEKEGVQLLATLAKRLLQVATSSSSNERLFSGWGHIVSKRRNRMKPSKQKKAVAIYFNHRVMKRNRNKGHQVATDSDSETQESD